MGPKAITRWWTCAAIVCALAAASIGMLIGALLSNTTSTFDMNRCEQATEQQIRTDDQSAAMPNACRGGTDAQLDQAAAVAFAAVLGAPLS